MSEEKKSLEILDTEAKVIESEVITEPTLSVPENYKCSSTAKVRQFGLKSILAGIISIAAGIFFTLVFGLVILVIAIVPLLIFALINFIRGKKTGFFKIYRK